MLSVAAVVVALVGPVLYAFAFFQGKKEESQLSSIRGAPLSRDLLVVIPARNEARRLPATLAALLADPSPHMQVVIVDDGSTDGTARVARSCGDDRVLVIEGPGEPPAGKFGKPRALAFGVAASSFGELVLCLDADVVVGPGTLGGLVEALVQHDAAALSGLPALDDKTAVEQALVPAFVAAAAASHPPSQVHDDESPIAFLNGQVLLVTRAALSDVGGFLAVQETVLEDVALARLLKARGHRLRLVDLRALATTRMYASFAEIVEGFAKNARALHGPKLVPLAAVLAAGALAPLLGLSMALWSTGGVDDAIAVLACGAALGLAVANRRRLGGRGSWGLASPAVQLVVALTYLRAAVSRRGRWRGRTFSTGDGKGDVALPRQAAPTRPMTVRESTTV